MPVKAKTIKDLPLKEVLDGSESLLVQDLNGTKQAPLGPIVDEIKQNSQEKIREIESELAQTNAQLSHTMKKTSFLAKAKTGFIAHRGSHINAPENTLKSIHQAGLYGYEMVEIDVNRTKDGCYILMHDDTVDRTTNGTGRVDSFTLDEIKQLMVVEDFSGKDANEIIRIPTLEEAVQECRKQGLGINLDCGKLNWTKEICEMAVSLLKKYGLYEKSFFVISNPEQRQLLTSLYHDVNVTWLAGGDIEPNIIEAKKYQNAFITYSVTEINPQMIARCHEENIPVFIYNCHDWDKAYSMIKLGVRFVETDWILPGGEF